MLDAAILGEIFTSPSTDVILEGIRHVKNDNGTLLIVKNYTGDNLNFEFAKDLATQEGLGPIETVTVNDDVALEQSEYSIGRRGISGTVLVHKIAGAKAEKNHTLNEVASVAKKVVAQMGSMSFALKPATIPATGKKVLN